MRLSTGRLGADAAGEMADLIGGDGCTIWIGVDGADNADADSEAESVTAIVDEQVESIRRQMGNQALEDARGRPIMLHLTPPDAQKVPEGTLLFYNGQQLTQMMRKSASSGNITAMVAILTTTGGV